MAVPSGFYAGSGTTVDPYYGYYKGNNFTDGLLELDRADAIRYMSGEIDQYGNPIGLSPGNVDRQQTETGVDPNKAGGGGSGAPDPNTGGGGSGAPPPVDNDYERPVADDWAFQHPLDTIFSFFNNRGGMGTDNPYFRSISSTASGLERLWSMMDPSWSMDILDTPEGHGLFREFVDDLFGAGGNVHWRLGTFRDVINNMMTGNLPEAMQILISEMDSPSEAMAIINELFDVFAPLMGPTRRRMMQTMLGNIWRDMSQAYSSGQSVQSAFTDAVAKLGRVFGLGS